jgi:cell division inhibitor SepF
VSALRKAGVWLGLIEDEDDQGYDDERGYADRGRGRERDRDREREYHASRYVDEYGDDEEEEAEFTPREPTRLERAAGVRSITRPVVAQASYPTRDNLALAPQVQLRERAVVAEDEDQRYQITTLHPTTYREARTIGEHFRDGVPVIINLTEMDEADARRLVDFAAGLAFGLRGTIERVTNRVFLLSPANVQVTAEDKARIAEGGFFNQS